MHRRLFRPGAGHGRRFSVRRRRIAAQASLDRQRHPATAARRFRTREPTSSALGSSNSQLSSDLQTRAGQSQRRGDLPQGEAAQGAQRASRRLSRSARSHRRRARARQRRSAGSVVRWPSARSRSSRGSRFRSGPSSTSGCRIVSAPKPTWSRIAFARRPRSICTLGDRMLIPAGSEIRGVVSSVDKAGRLDRKAQMTLSFDQITIDGRDYPIQGMVVDPSRARASRVMRPRSAPAPAWARSSAASSAAGRARSPAS